jgi:hypothetical protein
MLRPAQMARQRINRPTPRMAPEHYRTFGIANPGATHWRDATCAEVDCANWRNGCRVICDLRTEVGLRNARMVRDRSDARGVRYAHAWNADHTEIIFTFEPGQQCPQVHRAPVGRPALFIARNGDHRGSGRRDAERRVYQRSDQWQYDFAEHQDRLATAAQRG